MTDIVRKFKNAGPYYPGASGASDASQEIIYHDVRPDVKTLECRFTLDISRYRSNIRTTVEEQVEKQVQRELEQRLRKEMPEITFSKNGDLYTSRVKEIYCDDRTATYRYLIDYCNLNNEAYTASSTENVITSYILPKRRYYEDDNSTCAAIWSRGYDTDCLTYTTYATGGNCEWHLVKNAPPLPPPGSRLRDIIQSRQAPMLLVPSRKPLVIAPDIREIRARETLRRIIGDDRFRRFLKNAFIHVRGKSGKSYQIFTGHGITNVFENGRQVERLCVVLAGDFAPTDSLLMRYLLILNDEEDFRKQSISHHVYENSRLNVIIPDQRPLPEIFKSLKAVA